MHHNLCAIKCLAVAACIHACNTTQQHMHIYIAFPVACELFRIWLQRAAANKTWRNLLSRFMKVLIDICCKDVASVFYFVRYQGRCPGARKYPGVQNSVDTAPTFHHMYLDYSFHYLKLLTVDVLFQIIALV